MCLNVNANSLIDYHVLLLVLEAHPNTATPQRAKENLTWRKKKGRKAKTRVERRSQMEKCGKRMASLRETMAVGGGHASH